MCNGGFQITEILTFINILIKFITDFFSLGKPMISGFYQTDSKVHKVKNIYMRV